MLISINQAVTTLISTNGTVTTLISINQAVSVNATIRRRIVVAPGPSAAALVSALISVNITGTKTTPITIVSTAIVRGPLATSVDRSGIGRAVWQGQNVLRVPVKIRLRMLRQMRQRLCLL